MMTSNKTFGLTALACALFALAGCNNDSTGWTATTPTTPAAPTFAPIELNLAHINDHHSHLDTAGNLSFVVDGVTYRSEHGGFARITQLMSDLEADHAGKNFLKLHAGDAITGTQYYSFYEGLADADLMNTVCFDAFTLGNHEFDGGDEGLVKFIDHLHQGSCQTPVLAANVKPKVGTPLAPQKVDDYIKPYVIKETQEGVKVGIIGLNIASKTSGSSRPLTTTEFLDEATTAQNYINELNNQGIEHIILLTHYSYAGDKALASKLTGVDVIIGGDSHTLLGDFSRFGATAADTFGAQGDYPTMVTNKDGETVCIGQAWEYTKALGLMNVKFNEHGSVESCGGSAIMPVGTSFEQYDTTTSAFTALTDTQNQTLITRLLAGKADLLDKDLILPVAQHQTALDALAPYKNQLTERMARQIGTATEVLCHGRIPGTTRSATVDGCETHADSARGSDVAQIVAKAFLYASRQAQFSLQNAGGVRVPVEAGNLTYGTAYTILPFNNTLVNLNITGQEVIHALEDAIDNHMSGTGGDGSHPYADGLRWDLDLTQAKGNRVRNVEVRERATGVWSNIDLNKTYVMVTNDFIAEGRDGYTTLGNISQDANRVTNTQLLYTQSLVDYIQAVQTISRPERLEYSHKTVTTKEGRLLNP